MFSERTSVGLDVHARSIVAQAVDWQTGQRLVQRLVPATKDVLAWVGRLPGPVAVAYEAGPTGFGFGPSVSGCGGPLRGGSALEDGTAARRPDQDRQA